MSPKGYDIYKDAVIKILNEFKDWKAYSIGDESRSRPVINHHNHVELGFLKHKKVLEFLNKSEIAVVPSRWEEPFGRTALESSYQGHVLQSFQIEVDCLKLQIIVSF